jgi:glycosyltransferase involved in cell wall biosynthesis
MADVRNLLWAADGFILTSFYEGLSISMLEAFSCGLPLLLTDAPGFSLMRAFGKDIVWMPDPNRCADFEAEVLKALQIWSGQPAVISWEQHEFALRNFNTPVQFGKVVRLYEWLLTKA